MSTVIMWEQQLGAPYAVLLNATAAYCLDYDDSNAARVQRSTVSVILTALEEAEAIGNVTPNIRLIVLAIGYELALRFDMGFGPDGYDRRFHNTSVIWNYGAVVTTSKLRRLNKLVIEASSDSTLSKDSGST